MKVLCVNELMAVNFVYTEQPIQFMKFSNYLICAIYVK
jgi:hypothetical protein